MSFFKKKEKYLVVLNKKCTFVVIKNNINYG